MSEPSGATRRAGRPPQLSRELIVEAAATFDNVDTMTMRQLAQQLGVAHGALYRWVSTRDQLFDVISEVVVDHISEAFTPNESQDWREQLRELAVLIRHHFLAIPGYVSHLSRPHQHNAHSTHALSAIGTEILCTPTTKPLAEQSWLILITSLVSWLASEEQATMAGQPSPDFEQFLGVILRGLPATASAS